MQATLEIADAVKAAIDGEDLRAYLAEAIESINDPAYTVQRCYVPSFVLRDMDCTKVLVAAAKEERERISRSQIRHDHTIHVAVSRRFTASDGTGTGPEQAYLDALVTMAGMIGEWFESALRLPGRESAACLHAFQQDPLYDPKMFYDQHQLLSLVVLKFREAP